MREVEPELRQPPPRKVRCTDKSIWFGIAIYVFVFFPFLLFFTAQTFHSILLLHVGVEKRGYIDSYSSGRSPKGRSSYYAYFHYNWQNKVFIKHAQISGREYGAVPVGGTVAICLLRVAPGLWPQPVLTSESLSNNVKRRWLLLILSYGLPALVGFYFFPPLLARGIVRNGITTEGVITIVYESKAFYRSPDWRVAYEFFDDNGTLFRQSVRIENYQRTLVNEGNKVTVLYDRYDPRRSVIYLLSCWKVVA